MLHHSNTVNQSVRFLNKEIEQYCFDNGYFSTNSLKAIAEHISIFREISKKHPSFRQAISGHLRGIRELTTSPLFFYFCIINPKLFRLWGSILADISFFYAELKQPFQEFVKTFDLEYFIESETVDFRQLDAIDVLKRLSIASDLTEKKFSKTYDNAFLNKLFFPKYFDNIFIYSFTHFTFYSSDWGAISKCFTKNYYLNLNNVFNWSYAIEDADLIAEGIISILYSNSSIKCEESIELLINRQTSNGAIIRKPFHTETLNSNFEYHRHTTLVGIWAISEYCHFQNIKLKFDSDIDLPFNYRENYTLEDEVETNSLKNLLYIYSEVSIANINVREVENALSLLKIRNKSFPFSCQKHYFIELKRTALSNQSEMSILDVMTYSLLMIISKQHCKSCLEITIGSLKDLHSVIDKSNKNNKTIMLELIEAFLSLNLITPLNSR